MDAHDGRGHRVDVSPLARDAKSTVERAHMFPAGLTLDASKRDARRSVVVVVVVGVTEAIAP